MFDNKPLKHREVFNLIINLVKLGGCAREDRLYFALIEALAIAVVECDVTYRGPAVLDYGCGMEFGHGFMVLAL